MKRTYYHFIYGIHLICWFFLPQPTLLFFRDLKQINTCKFYGMSLFNISVGSIYFDSCREKALLPTQQMLETPYRIQTSLSTTEHGSRRPVSCYSPQAMPSTCAPIRSFKFVFLLLLQQSYPSSQAPTCKTKKNELTFF